MSPEMQTPWYEQYPRLELDTELHIESERTRMYMEVEGQIDIGEKSDYYQQTIAAMRERDGIHQIDHGEFAHYLYVQFAEHAQVFEYKEAARRKGQFDELYARHCSVYIDMLNKGLETIDFLRQVPGRDMNKLPEPILVTALFAGLVDRQGGEKPSRLIGHMKRYRPPQGN